MNNNLYNSYKNKILLKVLFIGIAMFLVYIYIAYINYHSKMDYKFDVSANSLRNIIKTEEERIVKLYKSRLIKNLKSYGVIESIRNNDREALYNFIKPRYDELKKENKDFSVMHFHTADNKSFLRMHQPEKYGDDLSSFRQIVVNTNKHKKENFGFERGKYGYFYRVILPISDNGKHIGSVEFGLKLEYFIKNLKRLLPDSNFAMMFLAKDLEIKDDKYKTLDQYSLVFDDNDFFENFINKIDLTKKYVVVHKNRKSYLISSNLYIKDYEGNDSIKILFAIDITVFKSDLIIQILFLLLIGGLTYLLSFFLINIGFKTYIQSMESQSKKLEEYTKIIDENIIVSSTDLKGVITYASSAFSQICGYSKEELIGKPHNIIRHKDMPKKAFRNMWDTIKTEEIWKGEVKNKKKDGSFYWVNAVISPIYDDNKVLNGYTAVRQDITDKKEIEEISQRDKLTQVYNRLKLDDVLESEISRSKRYNTPFSVILIDIDKFKEINDTYGHQVGDKVLIQIADILTKNLRKTDLLGRWGGEEFMIICSNTDIIGAKNLAEKLRKDIADFDFETICSKTASFGVSEYIKGEDEESILKKCDDGLYEAKAKGRNTVIVK